VSQTHSDIIQLEYHLWLSLKQMMPLVKLVVITTEPSLPRSGVGGNLLPLKHSGALKPTQIHQVESRTADSLPPPPAIPAALYKYGSQPQEEGPPFVAWWLPWRTARNSEKGSLRGNVRGRANHTIKTKVEAALLLRCRTGTA